MATLPAFLRRTEDARGAAGRTPAAVRAEKDPFRLRSLPLEEVFFYCKKIDNSRLVREADPKAKESCWSAIGVAGVALLFFVGVLAPNLGHILAGYRLEGLRAEERRLMDDRRSLEVREAQLLSPLQLEQLAARHNLTTPQPGQVVHLNGSGNGALAMVKK
jgi:hypothetical protein